MLLLGDCSYWLKQINDNSIDLTITSPPYDNLRTYGGYSFDFEAIAQELYRVTKKGGVIVWVVNDQVVNGEETGTAFKQALYFKQIGLKLHDTMIYGKKGSARPEFVRYNQSFEYMFILSKGKPRVFQPLKDRKSIKGGIYSNRGYKREQDGRITHRRSFTYNRFHMRNNIWIYDMGFNLSTKDDIAFDHPAIFPEALAEDHIKSWSNEGDLILDPLCGSGTTCKMAHLLRRKWIGIEINPEYVALAKKRLTPYIQQQRLTSFISSLS